MTRHAGPRPGSAPYKVICRLVDLGGTASIATLMEVLSVEHRRMWSFRANVTSVLEGYDFIMVDGDNVKATRRGKDFASGCLHRVLPVNHKYVGKIAAPRIAKPFKEANLSAMFPPTVVRAGAFDHLRIPSLMGGKRVLPGGEVVDGDA